MTLQQMTGNFTTAANPTSPSSTEGRQLLTFQLDDGVYGIDILQILEIRALSQPSPLPGSPEYVKGIMNLRGAIIPVIDLRSRLGLSPATEHSRFAVTIVAKVHDQNIGLIADAVNEVTSVPQSGIQHSTTVCDHGDQRFVQALALCHLAQDESPASGKNATMIVILDLERLYDPALDSVPNLKSIPGSISSSIAALHQTLDQTLPIEPQIHPETTKMHTSPMELTPESAV
jgi:purine-binding chemotaxis protein CheW